MSCRIDCIKILKALWDLYWLYSTSTWILKLLYRNNFNNSTHSHTMHSQQAANQTLWWRALNLKMPNLWYTTKSFCMNKQKIEIELCIEHFDISKHRWRDDQYFYWLKFCSNLRVPAVLNPTGIHILYAWTLTYNNVDSYSICKGYISKMSDLFLFQVH